MTLRTSPVRFIHGFVWSFGEGVQDMVSLARIPARTSSIAGECVYSTRSLVFVDAI